MPGTTMTGTPKNPRYREAFNSAVNNIFKHRDELKKIYSGEHANERFEDLFVLINSRIEVLTELMNSATKQPGEETAGGDPAQGGADQQRAFSGDTGPGKI